MNNWETVLTKERNQQKNGPDTSGPPNTVHTFQSLPSAATSPKKQRGQVRPTSAKTKISSPSINASIGRNFTRNTLALSATKDHYLQMKQSQLNFKARITYEKSKFDNIAKFEEAVDFENVDSSERSSVQPPRLAPSEEARSRPGTANKRTRPDRYGNLIVGGMDIIDDDGKPERPGTAKPPSN